MTIQVPAPVESRIRRRWSRRAKLIGYAVLAGYIGLLFGAIFLFKSGPWLFFLWTSGFALGVRYLRVGKMLESPPEVEHIDEVTQKMIADYEEKIRVEGQREVAHGTLSIPATTTDGGLSIAADAGHLSKPED